MKTQLIAALALTLLSAQARADCGDDPQGCCEAAEVVVETEASDTATTTYWSAVGVYRGDSDCDANVELAMSDTCLYVHTGGTTAVPKICIVTHGGR